MAKLEDIYLQFSPEGYPFMGLAILLTVGLGFLGWPYMVLGSVLTLWCFYFFRDPHRATPVRSGLIVSPADGKVVAIEEVTPDEDIGIGSSPHTRISIFLDIFNVHVNRIPVDGTVKKRQYRKGKFFNASLDKASKENERMALAIEIGGEHPHAHELLGVVQIAGLIARRIVCTVQAGETARAGERYGIIRFGSRVDVYLPHGIHPLVSIGQTMVGGETVLADCLSGEAARQGERRE